MATGSVYVMCESNRSYSGWCESIAEAKKAIGREKIVGWHVAREDAVGVLRPHGERTATTLAEAQAAMARLRNVSNPRITFDVTETTRKPCIWRGNRAHTVLVRDGCTMTHTDVKVELMESDVIGVGECIGEHREVDRMMIPRGEVLWTGGRIYTSAQ